MKAKQILPEGLVLVAIPYDLLSMMVENLQEMDWVLPDYVGGREVHNKVFGEVIEALMKEYKAG
jgi:hypothetical protein